MFEYCNKMFCNIVEIIYLLHSKGQNHTVISEHRKENARIPKIFGRDKF